MKVYIFSDIHGQGELFDKILDHMEKNKPYVCFFLGDACDRGPDGYKIMQYLLGHPEEFVYLKGNHEDMFVHAAREFIEMAKEEGYSAAEFANRFNYDPDNVMFGGHEMQLHYRNGGAPTFASWMKAGCPTDILYQLDALSVMESASLAISNVDEPMVVFDMCHAGCLMEDWDNDVEEAAIWDRNHFFQEWKKNDDGVPHILIHGHTPIIHMPTYFRKENGMSTIKPLRYNNGTKIDMDTACFHYGVINLFDVGEDEFIRFYKDEVLEMVGKTVSKDKN